MHHNGSTGSMRLGSLTGIREAGLCGFSLAEMLVVMLIMSFIVLGIPAIHFKKTELKTKRSLHGRYECYYSDGKLMQYQVNEEGAKTGPTEVASCSFSPPRNAVYFLIHAVGGGGGASASGGGINMNATTETDGPYTSANDFPEWMQQVQGAGQLPNTTTVPPRYTGVRNGTKAIVTYGKSGEAGKTTSIFFPRLKGVQIHIELGQGGALGQPGGSTIVKFNEDVIIEAEGGAGGNGSGTYPIWLDGEGAMCPVKELDGRKFNEADFTSSIEMDEDTEMTSMLPDALAGSGGAGSYGNSITTREVTYTINGIDVSEYVRESTCDNPTECDDGTISANCPAQPGKNGAVIILW